jgi:iron complex outermembrane receptor protein
LFVFVKPLCAAMGSEKQMARLLTNARRKILAAACGFFALTAAAAYPQSAPKDLGQMSIEDLSTLRVTSASKKEESVQRAAAAIYVITQEDIRRSGATNIPDLLRMVPGLDIAQASGTTWAVTSRGFNSQDANKLLVLIDGRTVYSPLVSGVFWEDLDVVLEDVERIEVIRGPGAALWGTNAVNGVINIITKKAGDTQGGLVSAGGGNLHEGFGLFQYGGKAGSHGYYRVFAKGFQESAMELSSGKTALDPWALVHGGIRMDWTFSKHDSLSVQGDIHYGGASNLGTIITSLTPPISIFGQQHRDLKGQDAMVLWTHTFSPRSGFSVQFYFDHSLQAASFLTGNVDTSDVEFEYHFGLGARQDIIWGAGFRNIHIGTEGTLTGSFIPPNSTENVWSSFLQDEIRLIPARLQLTLGLRLGETDFTGLEVQPDLRLLWTPSDKNSIWFAASRAIHGETLTDTGLRFIFQAFPGPGGITEALKAFGNPQVGDEQENSFQAGYRTQVSTKLELDLTGFFNVHSHVRGTSIGTPFIESDPGGPVLIIPLIFNNLVSGETHGVEVGANWKPYSFWRLGGGYTWLSGKFRDSSAGAPPNTTAAVLSSPHHEFSIRSYVDFPHGFQMDTSFYYVGQIDQGGILAYPRLDLRLAWKFKERQELSLVGQNLLSPRHLEFPPQNGPFNNSLMKRSVYAKWTFQF